MIIGPFSMLKIKGRHIYYFNFFWPKNLEGLGLPGSLSHYIPVLVFKWVHKMAGSYSFWVWFLYNMHTDKSEL